MITWFKELFTLISMIFEKTRVVDHTEIITMKYFPFTGFSYMFWCGRIVTRKENCWMGSESKNHELGHAKQAVYYKRWIYYYLVYCWEWLRSNPLTGIGAYYTIPFEMQAYGNQHDSTYDYNRSDLKSKYTIKKRHSTYKKYKYGWKNYCKSL